MATRTKARFIAPMLLLRTDRLADHPERWAISLKLDGYRAIAFKAGGKVHLRSRNDLDGPLRDLTHAVKAQRLEGLVAKRRDRSL